LQSFVSVKAAEIGREKKSEIVLALHGARARERESERARERESERAGKRESERARERESERARERERERERESEGARERESERAVHRACKILRQSSGRGAFAMVRELRLCGCDTRQRM